MCGRSVLFSIMRSSMASLPSLFCCTLRAEYVFFYCRHRLTVTVMDDLANISEDHAGEKSGDEAWPSGNASGNDESEVTFVFVCFFLFFVSGVQYITYHGYFPGIIWLASGTGWYTKACSTVPVSAGTTSVHILCCTCFFPSGHFLACSVTVG